MHATHASLSVGALVANRQGWPRLVIGVKPNGRVMTVGAPDPPWMAVGHIEVDEPEAYQPLAPEDLPNLADVFGVDPLNEGSA